MMDDRVKRITSEVRKIDRKLFAFRASNGMVQILREADRIEASDVDEALSINRPHPQFILALTDNFTLQGKPVEWGLEPIMSKLKEMDSWRDDTIYEKLLKEREEKKRDRERRHKSEIRDRAADLRKDFARATNDINTAGMS